MAFFVTFFLISLEILLLDGTSLQVQDICVCVYIYITFNRITVISLCLDIIDIGY